MRRFDSDYDRDYGYDFDNDDYVSPYNSHNEETGMGFLEFAFLKEIFGFRRKSGVIEDYILYKIFGDLFILWELLGLGRRDK